MKKLFLILVLFLSVRNYCQDYVFFSDSPLNNYYDPSWGFVNSPSTLERINTNKFPVDVNIKYSGLNSLRMHWTSKSGGDWGMAVAEQGWLPHDISKKEYLTFWAYTQNEISGTNMPVMYLEDTNNKKTDKKNISSYMENIPANVWTKVTIPLNIFIQSPGQANTAIIKTIFFGQSVSDETEHILYLDEISMVTQSTLDTIPPSVPTNVRAKGFDHHIDISWLHNSESDIAGYRIFRLDSSGYKIIAEIAKDENCYSDYIGNPPQSYKYKVMAFDKSMNQSEISNEASATTRQLNDEELLNMVQEATFRYFWDYAHPVSGLARERRGSDETVTSGGSGFGIMAILVGIERGFITRQEGSERMQKILNFLSAKSQRFHGAFSHWIDGSTGEAIPFSQKDNGGDLVETAYLIQGLLSARKYFSIDNATEKAIRDSITSIWQNVEWDWYRRSSSSNYLYWHWSPNYNWEMNMPLQGPNETMITYLLAIASPTHSVPASLYKDGWTSSANYKNGKSFYNIPLYVGWDYGGPLFFAHYSFLGFDPRHKKDSFTNYFVNNRNHTLINRAYCIDNPKKFLDYDSTCWGLTASDDPFGYSAHEPTNDNGTITPSAALSSFPYTPEESMTALKTFYYKYGDRLWGSYGFKDAMNVSNNWFANSYLAIDQGPIIIMIENYRTGLLWNNFMANPEIQPMLDSIGFVVDTTSGIGNNKFDEFSFELFGNYPNPFNPSTRIRFSLNLTQDIEIIIFDLLGRKVKSFMKDKMHSGIHEIEWNGNNDLEEQVSSGVYFYAIMASDKLLTGKMILQK